MLLPVCIANEFCLVGVTRMRLFAIRVCVRGFLISFFFFSFVFLFFCFFTFRVLCLCMHLFATHKYFICLVSCLPQIIKCNRAMAEWKGGSQTQESTGMPQVVALILTASNKAYAYRHIVQYICVYRCVGIRLSIACYVNCFRLLSAWALLFPLQRLEFPLNL